MTNDGDRYTEKFCPALWIQRRMFILKILTRFKIETVLDYGCGEAAVLSYLIPPNDHVITRMAGIDIDSNVLEEAIDRCTPWQTDFDQLRDHPLVIDIYKGSIGVPDDRFLGYQGIICSEVIEHVYSDVLDAFISITLGTYRPEIMIVTTPNGEYNINFPDLKYGTDESEFRHDDHKFEWTKNEFQTWCDAGAEKYGYDVEYHGIGLIHGKYDDLENGHCTQACIFIRRNDSSSSNTAVAVEEIKSYGNPQKLLKHIEFPYYNEPPLPKEKIIEELLHYIEVLCVSETYANIDAALDDSQKEQEEEEEGEEEVDLNIDITDWSTFNLEKAIPNVNNKVPIQLNDSPKAPKHTVTPLHLPISSLWNVLRIRQICKAMDKMMEFLLMLDKEDFQVNRQDAILIVKKAFPLDLNDDTHSVSTFSSRESW